jgi:hypothetical protein
MLAARPWGWVSRGRPAQYGSPASNLNGERNNAEVSAGGSRVRGNHLAGVGLDARLSPRALFKLAYDYEQGQYDSAHGMTAAFFRGSGTAAADQSPSVSSDAFPPAAVVFTVTVFSVAKRGT